MTENIQTPNPASGDPMDPNPDGRHNTQNPTDANASDDIMNDIDSLFGGKNPQGASGDGSGASGTQSADDPLGISSKDEPGKQQPTKNSFDGMTAEQRAAHFQSLYNKLENEYKEVKPQYEKYKSVADFVNQVYEDPKVKEAFLAELAPDLVKPKDPYEALQEQITKEFGEDFVPDEEEAQKPLSPSWRYYKRVDELYKDVSQNKPQTPKTLKELREERERQIEAANAEAEKERQDIMNDLKWSTGDWNNFSGWATKLKGKHLAHWYQQIMKQKGSAPNLVNQFGGTPTNTIPEVFQNLDNYFGK